MPKFSVNGSSGDVNLGYEATGTTPKLEWDASATKLTVTGTSSLDGAVVINESGADVDFRIESDTDANAFFLEGSSGNVGIGTSSPAYKLHSYSGANSVAVLAESSGSLSTISFKGSGSTTDYHVRVGTDGADYVAYTNNTERMRIDSNGNLLVGTTDTDPGDNGAGGEEGISIGLGHSIRIARSNGAMLFLNIMDADGDIAQFRKDGSTVGSIGTTSGVPYFVNNTTGGIAMGTLSGATVVVPVSETGANEDNVHDLGALTVRWDDIYATNGTIQTSDRNEKQDIEELSEAEQRVAVAAKGLLRKFRWKDKVAEKGDDARIHFGIIAQDLQAAFEAEGLDAGRYAMFISSTWWETQTEVEAVAEEVDEEGNVITEAKEAYIRTDTYETAEEAPEGAVERTRLGVRYPELLAFIIAAI